MAGDPSRSLKIDHHFFIEVGFGELDGRQEEVLRRRILDVLHDRVGVVLANSMTNSQREEFEHFIERDAEAAFAYLEENIPHYGLLLRSEMDVIANALSLSLRERRVVLPGDA